MGWLIEMVSKDPDLEVNNATLVLRLDDRNTPNILLECFMQDHDHHLVQHSRWHHLAVLGRQAHGLERPTLRPNFHPMSCSARSLVVLA